MPESEATPLITPADPQREWLVRCEQDDDVRVCAIWATNGRVEIVAPDDTLFTLDGHQIADYRDALDSAIAVAEADLRNRARPANHR